MIALRNAHLATELVQVGASLHLPSVPSVATSSTTAPLTSSSTTFPLTPSSSPPARAPPVQRAISNRNKRMALPKLLCAPLALSAADLGVESEGLQSLLAKRRAVEDEVGQLIGMA